MICRELELVLKKKEKDQHVMPQLGLNSTGNLFLETEESLRIPEKDLEKDKSLDLMLLLSEVDKVSIVSILLSLNFTKEIKLLFIAHLSMLMEQPILFHLLAISLFHKTLILPLK